MTRAAAVIAVCCALATGACAGKGPGRWNARHELVCVAATAWLEADPDTRRSVLSDRLTRALDKLAGSGDPDVRRVVDAGRKLVTGNGREITEAATTVRRFCH